MTAEALLEKVRRYNPGSDIDVVRRAYDYSAKLHSGQSRASGEPFLVHPLEVAGIIADLKLDVPSVVAGLLHDVVEDTLATLDDVREKFGEEVTRLVDGLTKLSKLHFLTREETQAENLRKMVVSMGQDIRVILIKLADRLHNMRTLDHLLPERQTPIAQETVDIYAPLAHRLGIYWMKSELEDNALRFLHPDVYHQLKRDVARKRKEREQYIEYATAIFEEQLNAAGIPAQVYGRPKHFYSIYRKMYDRGLMFDQIYDMLAFRIVVETISECYEALGVVHAICTPVPGRFKDYVALPKDNGYRSIHTTVIGPRGQRVEVQIRTREMHEIAELGIAAHWTYKGQERLENRDIESFAWLRKLLESQQDLPDPQEFIGSVKEDLFGDEITVFTPKGDPLTFPRGSTVIDFAYRVHTEVGHHCTGARVNGRLVRLPYRLHAGDAVEIITTVRQTPSRDWLTFVRTSRAKAYIRAWLKHQERGRSLEIGREILKRDLERHKLKLTTLEKEGKIAEVATSLSIKDAETLIACVGYGRVSSGQVLSRLLPPELLNRGIETNEGKLRKILRKVAGGEAGVRLDGKDDMLARFAGCCSPLPGEAIVGFITRGRGLTVHAADCSRVLEADAERRVRVSWDSKAVSERRIRIDVASIDQPGMLAAISKSISGLGINITYANVKSSPGRGGLNHFEVVVSTARELNRVMRAVARVRGVTRVYRVRS